MAWRFFGEWDVLIILWVGLSNIITIICSTTCLLSALFLQLTLSRQIVCVEKRIDVRSMLTYGFHYTVTKNITSRASTCNTLNTFDFKQYASLKNLKPKEFCFVCNRIEANEEVRSHQSTCFERETPQRVSSLGQQRTPSMAKLRVSGYKYLGFLIQKQDSHPNFHAVMSTPTIFGPKEKMKYHDSPTVGHSVAINVIPDAPAPKGIPNHQSNRCSL